MNQALPSSIDQLWHSPTLPMWLTVAAAGFFAIVLLVTLFRAERSVANGALTVITLLAIGIAVATMMRASGDGAARQAAGIGSALHSAAALPALSCLDGLAGESVENACERALFASADAAAAAVSYTAAQVTRLASFGNVAAADKVMTPELNALRRTIERDRYGLVAHVLTTRDGCSLSAPCPFFQSLTNSAQISSNMTEDLYDGTVDRHAAAWAAAPVVAGTANAQGAPLAALGTVPPPGRPVSGDFPSAASIPPVSIMSPEPSGQGSQSAPRSAEKSEKSAEKEKVETIVSTPARPSPGATLIPPPAPAAAKPPPAAKKPAPPKSRAQAPAQTPVQLAPPAAQSEDN
ncbi:hypothetical protein [Bradyrhizobium sp. SYSU BS000235]|uniref:hypothetical protein n=1 Tax=Bradyrhizobium sp. SYSU BS000235 TaxID=3411332 RepID=UPI003C756348